MRGRKYFVGDVGLLPPRLPVLLAGLLSDLLLGDPVRCGDSLLDPICGCRLPGSIGVVGRKVGVSRPGEAEPGAGECPFLRSGVDGDTRISVDSWGSFAGLESREALLGCNEADVFELVPLFSDEVLPREKMEEMRLEGFSVAVVMVELAWRR